ncbi:ABC transporter ATP-binding protein [Oceaniradius stylonematis]|uniref:ABC transporter ATP-binding protein n=1 Tax=Oceaniradius stylonematis TaxID=2184161 RepID=UPI00273F4F74|nr:ABC transporter ATP-binding protein [Oceaniradius stylonematis]
MLDVTALQVRYGAIEAVCGLDLRVGKSEIVALLGANGAGKSSTLAAISGLASWAGDILFEDESLKGRSPEAITRMGIGLVPEGRRIFAGLTVAENLLLGGAVHASPVELRRRAAQMQERFPVLAERRNQKAGLMSGGEQQMLAIARALMAQPKLLLMDEPSLGLAPQVVETVFDLIGSLRDEGITILLVEQNVPMSLDIADHALVLAQGRASVHGTTAEVAGSDAVQSAYLGH